MNKFRRLTENNLSLLNKFVKKKKYYNSYLLMKQGSA